MKVFVLGHTQSIFINQLYGDIKLKEDSFIFDIEYSNSVSQNKINVESEIFDRKINLRGIHVSKLQVLINIFKQFFSNRLWNVIFFEVKQRSSLKNIKSKLYEYGRAKYIANRYISPLNHDIYHFHYCIPQLLLVANFLPKKSKIIMSFWGSDLMSTNGISNIFYVRQALKKATKITLQSPEMARMLAEKYGYDLSEKVVDIRFTISTDIYNNINSFKDAKFELDAFKYKHGINKKDIVISLGHNANKENNHILMIEQIRNIPISYKKNMSFIIHLGYGGDEKYRNELKKIIKNETQTNYIIIEDYLEPTEIAKLRLITSIMLQLPVRDALSAAMTEVLYAGNCVIAGGWLPYDILLRNDIGFYKINTFEFLPKVIMDVFDKLKKNDPLFPNNKQKIKSFLFPDTTTKEWISLLRSIHNE